MSKARDGHPQSELELLAPWRATGKIDEAERLRFDAALTDDPTLREALAAAEDELAGAQALNESLPGPSAALGQRVFAAIEDERRPGDLFGRFGAWALGRFEDWRPRAFGAALAGAAVLFIAAGVTIGGLALNQRGASQFQTASDPQAQPAAAHFIARFAPSATTAQTQDLLTRHRLSIVSGPTAEGVFRLRVVGPADQAELKRLLDTLAAETGVVAFILPASG